MDLLISLLVGLIAGALAAYFIKGRGLGVIGDIIVGLIGGLIGGWLFTSLGVFPDGIFGNIIVSFIGACILLLIVKAIKKI